MNSFYFPLFSSSYNSGYNGHYDSFTGLGYSAASSSNLGSLLGQVNQITTWQPMQPVGIGDNYMGNFLQNLNNQIQPLLDISEFRSPAFLGSSSHRVANQASLLISGLFANGGSHSLNALSEGIATQNGIYNSVFSRGVSSRFLL